VIHLTAQVESFTAVQPEIAALSGEHYDALALDKELVPLDPDWDRYRELDARGQLCTVTLRAQGKLAGYCIMFVLPELHYRTTLSAKMDMFWVTPEYRGRMGGLRLFRTMERELKRRGCRRMFVGSKLHRDTSRMFEAMGYRHIEAWFSKVL